jgi:hypothetical protein
VTAGIFADEPKPKMLGASIEARDGSSCCEAPISASGEQCASSSAISPPVVAAASTSARVAVAPVSSRRFCRVVPARRTI